MKNMKTLTRTHGIAEAYIHIERLPEGLSNQQIAAYFEKNAPYWIERAFHEPISFRVTVEDGSMRAWIAAGAVSIYTLIAQYLRILVIPITCTGFIRSPDRPNAMS